MSIAVNTEIQAHARSVSTPLADIVRDLSDLLTRDLTAYVANVSDSGTINRWASGHVNPRPKHEQRLRVAYEIVQLLRETENSEETIRAWFLGLNPHLEDDPPVEAICEGRLKETLAAARAFVAGGS